MTVHLMHETLFTHTYEVCLRRVGAEVKPLPRAAPVPTAVVLAGRPFRSQEELLDELARIEQSRCGGRAGLRRVVLRAKK